MAQCTGAVSPGEVVRKAFPELLNYLGELSKTFDQRRNCLNMELSLLFISSFNQARSISNLCQLKRNLNSEKGFFLRNILPVVSFLASVCVSSDMVKQNSDKEKQISFRLPRQREIKCCRASERQKRRENIWSPVSCHMITWN